MAPRAIWKGFLKIGQLACPVAFYSGATTSERTSFHTINRKTGHRVRRQYVDQETGDPVEKDNQIKGYETGDDQYVVLEPEEVAQAVPGRDKTLSVEAFIACSDVDTVYFDKPYFLAPDGPIAHKAFAVVREGMHTKNVAALAKAVLFRRIRTVLIRAQGSGLVANTLNFDYEVRSAEKAFSEIPDLKIEGEMLDLAKHIIDSKTGKFDPREFDDRYETALAELVRAKIEGREIEVPKRRAESKVIDLLEALRHSAEAADKPLPRATKGRRERRAKTKKAAQRTKAAGKKREAARRRKAS
ncbi:MAG: Ku protein [Mesorhizobium sp.]|uniref:non-homologous end joining protein Ku n=1 Tax=Mesorhizobium sp. TaxID=1871066 RepID=UPI000FE2B0AB|nr:Ku protein [Mesorhizobium sp.]RWJ04933.1 MAG: Ku protein [Mesorhizobium sp.]RWJ11972.1 MAG: Ku protein [Mesorhizobium sp.]